MKWLFVLAGAVLVAIVLALPSPGPSPSIEAAKAPAPVAAPLSVPVAVPQLPANSAPPSTQPPMVLRGLIYRGKGSSESQALLAVDGKPQQLFRAGDAIAQGWSLQAIAPDHVIVAKDAATSKLAVVHSPAPSITTVSGPAGNKAAANEPPLPGFSQGGPPRASANGTATERNRRFLQAVQSRRTANP
jgi:hypothetical protein